MERNENNHSSVPSREGAVLALLPSVPHFSDLLERTGFSERTLYRVVGILRKKGVVTVTKVRDAEGKFRRRKIELTNGIDGSDSSQSKPRVRGKLRRKPTSSTCQPPAKPTCQPPAKPTKNLQSITPLGGLSPSALLLEKEKKKKRGSEAVGSPSKPKKKFSDRKKRTSLRDLQSKANGIVAGGGKQRRQHSDEDVGVYELMMAAERRFCEYRGVSIRNSRLAKLSPDDSLYAQFRRAFYVWQPLGVSAEDFIEAQYYWFNKWFNRPPKTYELGSANAAQRVLSWQEVGDRTKAQSPVVEHVLAAGLDVIIEHEKLMLGRMSVRWNCDVRGVFELFGNPEAGVFDQRFLDQHPVWVEMRKEGRWGS